MFRNRKQRTDAVSRWTWEHVCSARVDSAEAGLYFDAVLTYGWTVAENAQERTLHPDEVARSLLVGAVRSATQRYPVLHVQEAEWSANEQLSQEITTDDRIAVRGRVRLSLSDATESQARARLRARQQVHLEEAERTARLEVIRERTLNRGLGLLWWLEQHGPAPVGADPKQWTRNLVESYEELAAALRRDRTAAESDEVALLRARVEEALALAEDPDTAQRFARYLECYMTEVMGRPPEG